MTIWKLEKRKKRGAAPIDLLGNDDFGDGRRRRSSRGRGAGILEMAENEYAVKRARNRRPWLPQCCLSAYLFLHPRKP
jgi:hypothetical protein